jgi:ABC-type Na+ transport system ATPase subunit NatA
MLVVPYLRFAAKLRGMARGAIDPAIDRVLTACSLTKVSGRLLGHLSKGFRQRVGLAQALIHDPEVLILDEPTNGLDPGQIDEMLQFIRSLAPNRTIVLSTHILAQVAVCEKVVIISDGGWCRRPAREPHRDQRPRRGLQRAIAGLDRDGVVRNAHDRRPRGAVVLLLARVAYVLLAAFLALAAFFFALLSALTSRSRSTA